MFTPTTPHHPALARIHAVVDEALHSFETPLGRAVNLALIGAIIISTVIFVCDTLPYFDRWQTTFDQLEAIIAIAFTVEYALRLWVAPAPRWRYAVSLFSIFDLLAVVPFYLGFLPISFLRTFRMLRVLRVLRLLKLSRTVTRKLTKAEQQQNAFRIEMQILAIGFLTIWLIFSGIMYAIEHPFATKGFESVLDAMWYVIVTITTIGYGDVTPATAIGKVVASLIMLSGIGIIGTLTGIIGKAMMSRLAIDTSALEAAPENLEVVSKVTLRPCANKKCTDHLHHPAAKFCKTCGVKLKK